MSVHEGSFHEGAPAPLFSLDQAAAAAAEALTQRKRLGAATGARMSRESAPSEQRPVYRNLIDAFHEAGAEARRRYEANTPRAEWVAGRTRWNNCEHLQRGPAPAHWAPIDPEILMCAPCWDEVEAGLARCMRCGRPDDDCTSISVLGEGHQITLHAHVCDVCYPEGADAPRAQGATRWGR
jgi:hypothetical protein